MYFFLTPLAVQADGTDRRLGVFGAGSCFDLSLGTSLNSWLCPHAACPVKEFYVFGIVLSLLSIVEGCGVRSDSGNLPDSATPVVHIDFIESQIGSRLATTSLLPDHRLLQDQCRSGLVRPPPLGLSLQITTCSIVYSLLQQVAHR